MRPGAWRIVAANLARSRRSLIFSSVGIVAGIASFVFFIALGLGVKEVVFNQVLAKLPVNTLEVTTKSIDLGPLRIGSLLGKGQITEETLEQMRALPGVDWTAGEMNLAVPIQASGEFFGKGMRTDLAATGIDPRLVAEDVVSGGAFAVGPNGEVPGLVSDHLLTLYNTTFADNLKLPKLNRSAAGQIAFTLTVGRSYLQGTKDPAKLRDYPARLAGTSSRAILIGVTFPLDFVKKLNVEFNGADSLRYKTAFVHVQKPEELARVSNEIERLGYAVDALKRTAAGIIYLGMLLLSMFSALIVGIAAIYIANTFYMLVHERRREIGVLRAVGASRGAVRRIVLGEAAVVGLAGGLAGVIVGFATALLLDALAAHLLPEFPYRPSTYFHFPAWLLAGGVAFAVLCCLFGAYFPARRAAHLDPAGALRGD